MFFICFLGCQLSAQNSHTKLDVEGVIETLGKESVYLHYNSSLLLVGESFFYKFYCLDSQLKPSNISRLGYVELVNEDFEVVLRQKMELNQGSAYGDLFIQTNIPSGNYKLLAYTQWMKNWGIESFFQADIAIINPFRSNQKALLVENSSKKNSSSSNPQNTIKHPKLQLTLDKKAYQKREKVTINFKIQENDIIHGNYSILVRKMNFVQMETPSFLAPIKQNDKELFLNNPFFAPELRGELICGRIIGKDSTTVINNQKVALSILNTDYQLKIASTDDDGNFCISIVDNPLDKKGFFQVLGDENGIFDIILDEKESPDYEKLSFKKFEIDTTMQQSILNRSVHNQIENSFYSVKPDTIKTSSRRLPFYGTLGSVYELDDYTRFPSFTETMIEIIKGARINKRGLGKKSIIIDGIHENYADGSYKPLIVVDGIVLQNIEALIDYNANKIKSIAVVRDKYMFGSYVFAGIFDVVTFDQDFAKNYSNLKMQEINFSTSSNQKKYFKQQYQDSVAENYRNIPDYRYQLYWNPEVYFSGIQEGVEFYTSDVSGVFEIMLLGFSQSGRFIKVQEILQVE